jgi:hypothetical protein
VGAERAKVSRRERDLVMGGNRPNQCVVDGTGPGPGPGPGLGQSAEHIDRGFLVEEPAVREIGGEQSTDSTRSPTRKSGQVGQHRERLDGPAWPARPIRMPATVDTDAARPS